MDKNMNSNDIQKKFGNSYIADDYTFIMGIDLRFTTHFAERFINLNVLETCTGAGFTTISLAKTAKHVFTVEINKSHQEQAVNNVQKAGLLPNVSFIHGNILDQNIMDNLPPTDAAFIDPDWAATGPDHVYRFINSNTQPPADIVLSTMLDITGNVAIVLPPFINVQEFDNLPDHERESLYLDDNHELYCLYFGELMKAPGETEFHVTA
ncbi:MAG: hypothetical protein GY795_22405 [Desulfobacterales bacterium]|nr:hypothetical protein [Desulfobacterales bacterium]